MKVSLAAVGPAATDAVRDRRLALSAPNGQTANVLPGQRDRGRPGLGAGLDLLAGFRIVVPGSCHSSIVHGCQAHTRDVIFQMAEGAVPTQLFREIPAWALAAARA